jgi:hypothetical protein
MKKSVVNILGIAYLVRVAASDANNNQHQYTMTNPTTLADIRKTAASMFADPAVISVNVIASFGEVTVYRNGDIYMA